MLHHTSSKTSKSHVGKNCRRVTVSVVLTVRNDPQGCATVLSSLASQTRQPDEIIIVDGGSIDATIPVIRQFLTSLPQMRMMTTGGVNIAGGRNIGARAARSTVIASIDAGCKARPQWLANLIQPFEEDDNVEAVAGHYKVHSQTLLERVVGLATMRGALEPIDPVTFNPSARSMAFTKSLWHRSGGWPEWIGYSEDTLFDHKIRALGGHFEFASDAIVDWRPRTSLRAVARQFYNYGTGRGHTQIDAAGYLYSIRNVVGMALLAVASIWTIWAIVVLAACFTYFFIYAHHRKAWAIAMDTHRLEAYLLTMLIMWIITLGNCAGYVVGSWQRWKDQERYKLRMETYLSGRDTIRATRANA